MKSLWPAIIVALFVLSLSVAVPPGAAYGAIYRVAKYGSGDFRTIQAGIDAALDGDTVLVAPGAYLEYWVVLDKKIELRSEYGPQHTSIDALWQDSVMGIYDDAILDGFTLRNGFYFHIQEVCGGGIVVWSCSATIRNCIVKNNILMGLFGYGGGGIGIGEAHVTIENCTIEENLTNLPGGGIHLNYYSSMTIMNSTIVGNIALGEGGGIYISMDSTAEVTGCTIASNVGVRGGGISIGFDSSADFTNCMIAKNNTYISQYYFPPMGGGILFDAGANLIAVTNCTFTQNGAFLGGAIAGLDEYTVGSQDARVFISNSILWDDKALLGPEIYNSTLCYSPTVRVESSDVRGGSASVFMQGGSLEWLEGNITADPLFICTVDYHLSPGSPCVDAGTDVGVSTDIDGDERPQGAGFDMGADEVAN